ncbi:MAG TPA: VOC family protein [Polyangiaceae bacterium]|nr:VOC family protein [Polyangiaceae bacterium]
MPYSSTPYLYFKGDCEAALEFYERCGLGKVRELRRYEGTPALARAGAEWTRKVLHSLFDGESRDIQGERVRFYASDGPDSEPMKGCALLIEEAEVERASRLFDELSRGGRVTVAFDLQFWGDYYGNFTDKFGVQWAILTRSPPGRGPHE